MLTYSEITAGTQEDSPFFGDFYCESLQANPRYGDPIYPQGIDHSRMKMLNKEYDKVTKAYFVLICGECYKHKTGCKPRRRFYIDHRRGREC